jgi:hypothetical protein
MLLLSLDENGVLEDGITMRTGVIDAAPQVLYFDVPKANGQTSMQASPN